MRHLIACFVAMAFQSACKPSEFLAPDANRELAGAAGPANEVPSRFGFPGGVWQDGFGGTWQISVDGQKLKGVATSASIAGAVMTGAIDGDLLRYEISMPDMGILATGTAVATDPQHAMFATYDTDGRLNLGGILHFNHAPDMTMGQPVDLRPPPPCDGPQ